MWGISYCIRTCHNEVVMITKEGKTDKGRYRIRKLTPRECWRLQGLTFDDCDKAGQFVSNSSLYKQAGNGIVTDCVKLLFEHLYKSQYDPEYITYDENFTRAAIAQ